MGGVGGVGAEVNLKLPTMYLLERQRSPGFFTFDIIISHIFPENFIEIPQVVQKKCLYHQPTLNRLFNNSVKLYCIRLVLLEISSS